MTFKNPSGVHQLSASAPGVGTVTLVAGPASLGRVTFDAAVGTTNTCFYGIEAMSGSDGAEWGVGTITTTAGVTTLARDTVIENTNGTTSKINFTTLVSVWVAPPGVRQVNINSGGTAVDLPSNVAISFAGTGAATTRANLGAAPSTGIAQSAVTNLVDDLAGKQASDATLTSLSGLALDADKMLYATAADTLALSTLSAFARSLLDDADAATMRATLGVASLGANILINGDGRIDQRSSGSNVNVSDDAYGSSDRWYSLTQTDFMQVIAATNGADGVPFYQQTKQPQATAQRMGRAQIVASADSRKYRGGSVALSGKIRFSVAQAVRYAILSWSGTADVVTSDVVNDWTSGSYTAGGFFNSTTLAVVGVGSITPAAATWTDITALTGTVPSTCNNLIVVFWTEGTAAQNVTLDFTAKLESGSIVTPDVPRPVAVERQICEYFFQRFGGSAFAYFFLGLQNTTSTAEAFLAFPTKRISPTLSSTAASTFQSLRAGPVADTMTAIVFTNTFQNGCRVGVTVGGTPLTPGDAMIGRLGASGGYIDIDAEL